MTSRDVGASPCGGGMRIGEFRVTEFRLHPAVWYRSRQTDLENKGEGDVEGWFVRDRDWVGIGPWRGNRRPARQRRRAHRSQLFHEPEGGRSHRRSLPQARCRSRGGPGGWGGRGGREKDWAG